MNWNAERVGFGAGLGLARRIDAHRFPAEGFGNPAREIGERFPRAGRFTEREGLVRAVDAHVQPHAAAGDVISYGYCEIALVEPAHFAVPTVLIDEVENHVAAGYIGDPRAPDFMGHKPVADCNIQPCTAVRGDFAAPASIRFTHRPQVSMWTAISALHRVITLGFKRSLSNELLPAPARSC